MRRPWSFQTQLLVALLGFQGLLWLAVLPASFFSLVSALRSPKAAAVEAPLDQAWAAARKLESLHPEWATGDAWKSLTAGLEGIRREDQAARSLATEALVLGLRNLLLLAVLQLFGLVLTAVLASRVLSKQVRQLNQAVVRLQNGDRTTRLPPLAARELRDLGHELNQLLDALAAGERRLSELGKLQGWQETARFLSHQIKNPLTALGLAASNLGDLGALNTPLARQNAEVLSEETAKLLVLVNRLKELTAFGELNPEHLDLATLVQGVAARTYPVTLGLDWKAPASWPLVADRLLVEQVVFNLLVNSAQASEPAAVTVKVWADGRALVWEDSLTGLDPQLPNRLFHPPFTTKEGGTGLGLSFCRRILQLHGGDLTADLNPAGGLRFRMTFEEEAHADRSHR
ncbi:MAG: HAMP domain-containing sensor histidine kinase [Spirochaetales bacterium]